MNIPQQQFDKLVKTPNLTIAARKKRLKRLQNAIEDNSNAIVNALNNDYGRRCEQETRIAEIMLCISEIKHTLKHMDSWAKGKVSTAGIKFLFSKNAVIPQPMGVVGIISPWNYPFNLAIVPLIAAISAGNKVMLKPSEMTPNTAEIIKTICSQAFLESEVAVSIGDVEVAKQFSELPFMHLLFTGSTIVGKIIMQAAASNLVPVTLELGGKSPVIIDKNYSIKKAAKSIVGGKLFNAGQTCIAPDYIMVDETKQLKLIEAIEKEIKACYPDVLNNSDYTAIINKRHFTRLTELANASSQYKCLWPLGSEKDATLNIFPPLLVINPKNDNAVMQDEIFGPILPIIAVKSVQESIAYINTKANPLTLYIFSHNSKFVKNILDNTLSGSVAVNETIVQFAQDGVAFGGIGESGMGSYHGQTGFNCFSHMKSVYYQSRINTNSIIRAPYTAFKKKVIGLLNML